MDKKINKNMLLFIVLVILESFIVKAFMYEFLPDKFFYDSNGILNSLNAYSNVVDISRKFTIMFFSKINFLGFTSIKQWGWFLSILFTILIVRKIASNKKYNFAQMMFIIMSVALLNIYVFNISKDIIQFIIFLVLFEIITSKKSNNTKVILSVILLFFEALFFRVYYLIMALLIFTNYFIYKFFIEKKKVEKKNIVRIIILGLILFFAQVYVLQKISVENYNSIMFARSSVNIHRFDSGDANTIIIELFGNNNSFIIFILNYVVNFIRLLFPFELLIKSLKYSPFVIYQLLITSNLLKFKGNINNNNIVLLIIIISFFMTSAIFEPDFGSFIRHESTMFLIFLHMFLLEKDRKEIKLDE